MFRNILSRARQISSVKQTLTLQRRHLPVCTIDTSVPQDKVPPDFSKKLSKIIAGILDKPEKNISVVLRPSAEIIRDGNNNPSVLVHIWSIGVFDEVRNPQYSRVFTDFLSKELGLPVDRITLLFHPIEKVNAGHLLYAELMEGK